MMASHGRRPAWKWAKSAATTAIISGIAVAIYRAVSTWPQELVKKYFSLTWFAIAFTLFCIGAYQAPKEKRRKAGLVRSNLAAERCARCGGTLGAWDGQYHPGDVHFNPGSWLPKVSVRCVDCHAEQVFYVDAQARLMNHDTLFSDLSSGGGDV
jgi:hypothetical protein